MHCQCALRGCVAALFANAFSIRLATLTGVYSVDSVEYRQLDVFSTLFKRRQIH